MTQSHYFFCGGGTGGHIYPALAIAEQIKKNDSNAEITFFCSKRPIDSQIFSKTSFDFLPLPACGFSLHPCKLFRFSTGLLKSYLTARKTLKPAIGRGVVISVGGFVAPPVVLAAHRLQLRIAMLNVDIVPGRANKLLARFAREIFVQFADTAEHFAKTKANVNVTGCPLREGFQRPDKSKAVRKLQLDEGKKTLLVTGASSGSANINNAVCALLNQLNEFASNWQIVHLTGRANYQQVKAGYENAKIAHRILDYYDDMPNLYAAADLVIGRAGAVSVAEYAAAGIASICLPYPYHKDKHQYLNAGKLVKAGAAVIVDDLSDYKQTANVLCRQLFSLIKDDTKRQQMANAAREFANLNAAETIAAKLRSI